ncbi:MAG: porphobilinogen synthase [Spirochaetaceae bacterium]|jgi:porphobilinogen synthase|nr:porphobilinogen synthase [Spirochaetaceae bacterium]
MEILKRPRRLRYNKILRESVRETRISISSLIYPVFVKEGRNIKEEIASMPGQYRISPDKLPALCDTLLERGVNKIIIFGIPEKKDEAGSGAYSPDGVVQQAVRIIKQSRGEMYCITDLCMCEYTNHGHCGILKCGDVDNDLTLDFLASIALSQAAAGADMIAPSDMMDGRVRAIRMALDSYSYQRIPIMAYSAKYASAFYGPFRSAADSAPVSGDRKTYQMDYHNKKEARKEVLLDIKEGADIVMVKPALSYLDVIQDVSRLSSVPVAAYSVSGEYSMIKAAAAVQFVDEAAIVCETAASIFRAGAAMLISYFTPELALYIKEGRIG